MAFLHRFHRIQTKLVVLSVAAVLCLLFFAGIVISSAYTNYLSLKNFQQTSRVSIVAAELAGNLTEERQSGYNASGFLGDGEPLKQIEAYDGRIKATQAKLADLHALAKTHRELFSARFNEGLQKAIDSEARLNELRGEILNTNRPLVRDESSKLKSKTLSAYDLVLQSHANFLPLLCTETQDAELARRIITLDNLARLQRNFWKTKGLVGSALRSRKVSDLAAGEIKTLLVNVDDHLSRLQNLSNAAVAAAIVGLVQTNDYREIISLAQKTRELVGRPEGFQDMPSFADYQNGPSTRIESEFGKISRLANLQIADYTEQRLGDARLRVLLLSACSIFSVLCITVLMVFVTRSITRRLKGLSEKLDEAAGSATQSAEVIAGSANQLSSDSSEQAAALEEISASMEELSGMTSNNLVQIKKLSGCAEQALRSSNEGVSSVARLTEAMSEIQKSTSDVASIIKAIDEIAFQTNILALNAAVEAARAGEAGAGFAVVADEVRALAQRSAHAARETADKIESAVRSSAQGNTLSIATEKTFAEISSITSQYHLIVQELEAASTQSTEGLNQVKSAIQKVDHITQRTAAAAEENASASVETKAQVEKVYQSIQELDSLLRRTNAD